MLLARRRVFFLWNYCLLGRGVIVSSVFCSGRLRSDVVLVGDVCAGLARSVQSPLPDSRNGFYSLLSAGNIAAKWFRTCRGSATVLSTAATLGKRLGLGPRIVVTRGSRNRSGL